MLLSCSAPCVDTVARRFQTQGHTPRAHLMLLLVLLLLLYLMLLLLLVDRVSIPYPIQARDRGTAHRYFGAVVREVGQRGAAH
jgi:hypothetical protein